MIEQVKAFAVVAYAWAYAHPIVTAYIVGTLVTAIFKPRTPEQFAAMPHWKASLLKLVGAVFTDPAKAQQAILSLILRKPLEATFMIKAPNSNEPHDTDPPAGAPAVLAVPLTPAVPILAIAACLVLGCGAPGAKSPARDYARAGLSLVAQGQKEADHLCAELAQQKLDAKLAKTCADEYDTGRASLLAGQAVIDSWDSAQQADVFCAAGRGVEALKNVAAAIASAGGPAMPPLVQDALSLGSELAVGCKDAGAQ